MVIIGRWTLSNDKRLQKCGLGWNEKTMEVELIQRLDQNGQRDCLVFLCDGNSIKFTSNRPEKSVMTDAELSDGNWEAKLEVSDAPAVDEMITEYTSI